MTSLAIFLEEQSSLFGSRRPLSLRFWSHHPQVLPLRGRPLILAGIDLYMAAAVFVLSYYNRTKSFLFRWIMWVCENFSFPRSARMAFFYAGLSFFLGTINLLQGFGLWTP
jgi:hypothetical protein